MSKICLKNIKSQLRDCLPLQRSSRFAYSSVQAKQFKAGWGSFCLMTYRTIKKIECSLIRLGHSKLRPCLSLNELTLCGFRLTNLDCIQGKLGVQTSK